MGIIHLLRSTFRIDIISRSTLITVLYFVLVTLIITFEPIQQHLFSKFELMLKHIYIMKTNPHTIFAKIFRMEEDNIKNDDKIEINHLKKMVAELTILLDKAKKIEQISDFVGKDLGFKHYRVAEFLFRSNDNKNIIKVYVPKPQNGINNISIDSIAVDNDGIIGKVIKISNDKNGNTIGTIQLIFDKRFRIPALSTSGDRFVVGGNGSSKYLDAMHLKDDHKINVGDIIFTSNESNLVPHGIIIGTVSSISQNIIRVIPISNVDKTNYIAIVQN